jgi:ABC-type dipeptide/oligopeptide/nickel transport system permease component
VVLVRQIRRAVVTVAGVALVIVGGVLLVLPGPGFLVIAAGFAVLATEYEWARRLLEKSKDRALQAAEQATRHWWSSALTIATGVGMLAFGVALIVVEQLPLSGALTGGSLIFGAVALLATAIYAMRTPGYGSHPPDPEPTADG